MYGLRMDWQPAKVICMCKDTEDRIVGVEFDAGVLGDGFPALALVPEGKPWVDACEDGVVRHYLSMSGTEDPTRRPWAIVALNNGYTFAKFQCWHDADAFVEDSLDYVEWDRILPGIPTISPEHSIQITELAKLHNGGWITC